MARTFAFLMDPKNEEALTDEAIFHDISITIENALEKVKNENSNTTHLAETAYQIALRQLI